MGFPILQFDGTDFARRMNAVYTENLHDMVAKADNGKGDFEKGFFHTSTIQHEGTCYHKRSWTRDAGRGLIELARFGFLEEARFVADYLLTHINLGDHWGRTTQFDDNRHFEVDGNGLVLLGIYNTWKRDGRSPQKAGEYLEKLEPVIRWAKRSMEECRHGYLFPCQTELAGNPNAPYNVVAIYPNYAMAMALEALTDMAGTAGLTDTEAELNRMHERLAEAIRTELVSGEKKTHTPKGCWINGLDDRDGRVYDFSEWDGTAWPVYHWTRQVPYILQSDLGQMSLSQNADAQINRDSYHYLQKQMCRSRFFRKYGFVSNTAWTGTSGRHDDTMCGYGQGFMTQAALIMDDVNTYTKLLEGIARLAYDGSVVHPLAYEMNPWLMHECFTYENYEDGTDHTFGVMAQGRPGLMNCPGDEGNLVQEAEIVKVFSLVAGVDDSKPGILTVMPRIPWEWSSIRVEDFPFTAGNGRSGSVSYAMVHDRSTRTCRFSLHSSVPLDNLDVRVGPFPPYLESLTGDLRQKYEVEQKENSTWVWLRGLKGTDILQEISLW